MPRRRRTVDDITGAVDRDLVFKRIGFRIRGGAFDTSARGQLFYHTPAVGRELRGVDLAVQRDSGESAAACQRDAHQDAARRRRGRSEGISAAPVGGTNPASRTPRRGPPSRSAADTGTPTFFH